MAARRSLRSSRSAQRRKSTNTRFWSLRSTRKQRRSVKLYRDRGDGENIFDEMNNQWGCGGYTTHDLARCRLAARLIALFYDWWNIFVRLADPSLHREAITSRPLFLSAIATRTRHARQTTIRVTSSHAKAKPAAAKALAAVAAILRGLAQRGLAQNAEQLTRLQTWRAILSRAFQAFSTAACSERRRASCPVDATKTRKIATAKTSDRPTAVFRMTDLFSIPDVVRGWPSATHSIVLHEMSLGTLLLRVPAIAIWGPGRAEQQSYWGDFASHC